MCYGNGLYLSRSPLRVGPRMGYLVTTLLSIALKVLDLKDYSLFLQHLAKLLQFLNPFWARFPAISRPVGRPSAQRVSYSHSQHSHAVSHHNLNYKGVFWLRFYVAEPHSLQAETTSPDSGPVWSLSEYLQLICQLCYYLFRDPQLGPQHVLYLSSSPHPELSSISTTSLLHMCQKLNRIFESNKEREILHVIVDSFRLRHPVTSFEQLVEIISCGYIRIRSISECHYLPQQHTERPAETNQAYSKIVRNLFETMKEET